MFPGLTDIEIANKLAEYFNRISQEYQPLQQIHPEILAATRTAPEMYAISARLKRFKKPNSIVRGDIPPKLVCSVADFLAIPLKYIFDQVYSTLEWPALWRSETVSVIPKNNAPADMGQLRNLSCTPLFSKLLESFILEELQSDTKLSLDQYGGIKGVGADHFLVGTWQLILESLEDPRAATTLLSIDFAKAFNRMDHFACLDALKNMGASKSSLGLVQAFLTGRTMSVKIGNARSDPRTVPGGSPQGSILGNYLFCSTTNGLTQNVEYKRDRIQSFESISEGEDFDGQEDHNHGHVGGERNVDVGTEVAAASGGAGPGTSIEEVDVAVEGTIYGDSMLDETIAIFGVKNRLEFDSDDSINATFTQDEIDRKLGIPDGWETKNPDVFIYIDAANSVEKVRIPGSIVTISEHKRLCRVHAPMSEELFQTVSIRASEINMNVNADKTQLLCISVNNV